MKINLTSVMVTDQQKALTFYTEKLGFVKHQDVPMGEHRWLTVKAPDGADGIELLLEPLGFEPARDFQQQLYAAGIPYTSFESDDLHSEFKRLQSKGVAFRGEPQAMGGVNMVLFDDTVGNLICLVEKPAED
jgi:catechol 2,3-dioxygenase-like lactoylglutathione lyase family enzyme